MYHPELCHQIDHLESIIRWHPDVSLVRKWFYRFLQGDKMTKCPIDISRYLKREIYDLNKLGYYITVCFSAVIVICHEADGFYSLIYNDLPMLLPQLWYEWSGNSFVSSHCSIFRTISLVRARYNENLKKYQIYGSIFLLFLWYSIQKFFFQISD